MLSLDVFLDVFEQGSKDAFLARFPEPVLLVESHFFADDDLPGFHTSTFTVEQLKAAEELNKAAGDRGAQARAYVVFPLRRAPQSPWQDKISIGRANNNDLVLKEPSISKLHGYFEKDAKERWHFSDAESQNGSELNGTSVGGLVALADGNTLRLGSVVAKFLMPQSLYDMIAELAPKLVLDP